MQIKISKADVPDAEYFIRRCGYGRVLNRRSGQTSYAKRLHRDLYPCFHVYIKEITDNWVLDLHLDQRAPIYAGVTAHSGEYEGEVVEKEAERIQNFL